MIDVFIFTTERSLEIALLQYKKLVADPQNIVALVCPEDCVIPAGISVLRDSQVPSYDIIVNSLSNVTERKGWYLQQMLKLSCCYSSARDCLVLDGDTYFSDRFIKILKDGGLATTNENVKDYNAFLEKFNLSSIRFRRSFITNCMYFPSELRRHVLISIDELGSHLRDYSDELFSEYQYVGSKRMEFGLVSEVFKMRMFRRADLLSFRTSNLENILSQKKYDAICFEQNHSQTLFKRIAAFIAFKVGYAW